MLLMSFEYKRIKFLDRSGAPYGIYGLLFLIVDIYITLGELLSFLLLYTICRDVLNSYKITHKIRILAKLRT